MLKAYARAVDQEFRRKKDSLPCSRRNASEACVGRARGYLNGFLDEGVLLMWRLCSWRPFGWVLLTPLLLGVLRSEPNTPIPFEVLAREAMLMPKGSPTEEFKPRVVQAGSGAVSVWVIRTDQEW